MHEVRDWISIAHALTLIGRSSFVASGDDVRRVLECVDRSDVLRLGRIVNRLEAIPKPLPVDAIIDRVMTPGNPADRSGLMMELFIVEA
ncbi:hypothetical protein [Rhodococcoides kroppenstedtii]